MPEQQQITQFAYGRCYKIFSSAFRSSLAICDGDPVKTSKANLLYAIEGDVTNPTVTNLFSLDSAFILDRMAMLQTLTVLPKTFRDVDTGAGEDCRRCCTFRAQQTGQHQRCPVGANTRWRSKASSTMRSKAFLTFY